MKRALIFILLLTSASTAQAAVLLEAVREPGFEVNPQTKRFQLHSHGAMVLEITTHRENNKKEYILLGWLLRAGVKKIEAQIAGIDSNAVLKDAQEGQPMCSDVPTYSTRVLVNGSMKEIAKSVNCHEWVLEGHETLDWIDFGRSFLD